MQRDQSIRSARRSCASSKACKRSQTPASCQARSRRQQLMPEPQPSSLGSISQGMPLWSTNKIPARTARSSSGKRPGYLARRGLGGGKSGAISAHNSSSRIDLSISSAQKTAQRLTKFSRCEQRERLLFVSGSKPDRKQKRELRLPFFFAVVRFFRCASVTVELGPVTRLLLVVR